MAGSGGIEFREVRSGLGHHPGRSPKPRVCLLTPGQPSTNPRLVKEADALAEAGFQVKVIHGYWTFWSEETDRALMEQRSWEAHRVGGHPRQQRLRFHASRARHFLARQLAHLASAESYLGVAALGRTAPDLISAALNQPADLYIAHNLPALPAAVLAARHHGAKVGYDAEDLAGDSRDSEKPNLAHRIQEYFLPGCSYLTAASEGMALEYQSRYNLRSVPEVIYNVFPLDMRPSQLSLRRDGEPLSLYWFSQTIGRERGLELVLEAMAASRAPTRLHLRGQWQPGYRETLANLAESLGMEPTRMISHPPADPEEMARLAAEHDIGLAVEPGRDLNNDITVSNKIFTYLLAGNAIAATATRGQAEVCKDLGGAAFTFSPGAPEALARQLDRWFEDRSLLNRARRRSWELGGNRYNWDQEKPRFLKLVEAAVGG